MPSWFQEGLFLFVPDPTIRMPPIRQEPGNQQDEYQIRGNPGEHIQQPHARQGTTRLSCESYRIRPARSCSCHSSPP